VKIRAIVSRSFSWRLIIFAGMLNLGITPVLFQDISRYPWISAACWCAAIVVLHPIMDKDVPTMFSSDMLKSPRTYIGTCLFIAAQLVDSYYYHSGQSDWRIMTDAIRAHCH